MDDPNQLIRTIAVLALPLLFAITVHEAAHGYVARMLGDTTASMLGRVTLNPIKHIDPVGTLIVPTALFLFTGFVLGWAKPVPVNTRNLRRPKRDMAVVAIAGPAANLVMALCWGLVLKLGLMLQGGLDWVATPLVSMGNIGIVINLILMVLNLLPIPPLDGGRVMAGVLPLAAARWLDRVERYGLIILVGLLMTGVLGQIISPAVAMFRAVIMRLLGL